MNTQRWTNPERQALEDAYDAMRRARVEMKIRDKQARIAATQVQREIQLGERKCIR
jgi:type II secretory pathway component PulK